MNTGSAYCIRLTHDEFEGGELQVIEGAFRQIYVASNGPLGMALLLHCPPGQAGCRVYLTASSLPHAAVLVKAYSALPEALFLPVEFDSPMELGMPAVATQVEGARPAQIELQLGNGRCLRFDPALDAGTLTQVIRAVEAA